jgi:hypothetical protein
MSLSNEDVRELFYYNEDTGVLLWRNHRNAKARAGSAVGSIHRTGYRITMINKKNYAVHLLIWQFVYEEIPNQIDHINGNKADNRLCNLRACNASENGRNKRLQSNNSTGFKGVSFCIREGSYQATCRWNGSKKWLGYHATAELAHAAYVKFASQNHGAFYNGAQDAK